jgi:hypothetical protein
VSGEGSGGEVPAGAGDAPVVRLAHVPGAQGDNVLLGQRGVEQLPKEKWPAILVSFVYLKPFLKLQRRYAYRDWALDSGAFSAYNSGTTIRLDEYIDVAKRLLATDPTIAEVFALDVIGDWRASLRNCEVMWSRGVPAIPCWHAGEPWDALASMARDYPKIALGGVARTRESVKMAWAEQVFARVWPKRVHGFGFGGKAALERLPFHSIDATNWEILPCGFGHWQSFGKMSVRGSKQNLRCEVEWYLDQERKARVRWKREMALLDSQGQGPSVRLAIVANDRSLNNLTREALGDKEEVKP